MKRAFPLLILLFSFSLFAQSASELNRRGVDKANSNDLKNAIEDFDAAIEKNNISAAKVYHNMGHVTELKGDEAAALKYYEEALNRDPDLVPSLEKACELYTKSGLYANAIIAGEKVLKLDPMNKNVIPWLETAYSERFNVKRKEISLLEKDKIYDDSLESAKEEKGDEKKRLLKISLSGILRYTFISGEDKEFKYVKTAGLGPLDFPFKAGVSVDPSVNWSFSAVCGVPYFGALMPEVLNFYERVEVYYGKDNVYLGLGLSGYHYRGDEVWGVEEKFNDFKIGFALKTSSESSDFLLQFYPALIPYDAGYSPVRTLDVSHLNIEYLSKIKKTGIKARFTSYGFTFYDHGAGVSNYAGTYDIALGLLFQVKRNFNIFTEFCERVYMIDSLNEKPYSGMNGQGFFGFNRFKWFKGAPMSGHYSNSHVISCKFEEKTGSASFYQKLSVEIVPPSKKKYDVVLDCGLSLGFL
ncbi:MAG: tetratricopeptide repeat protein [Spirochaetes bacterium]|nr:tetratricopeptide repeat protein [Spirochaetota bacterium]